jgi:hypothetical protein
MIRGWVRIGWHLDGMTWEQYLRLTMLDRWYFHEELGDIIAQVDGDGNPHGRPKNMRK